MLIRFEQRSFFVLFLFFVCNNLFLNFRNLFPLGHCCGILSFVAVGVLPEACECGRSGKWISAPHLHRYRILAISARQTSTTTNSRDPTIPYHTEQA